MSSSPVAPAATARALDRLCADAELAAPHELADLVDGCARELGALSATAFVADLQQHVLQPLPCLASRVQTPPAADVDGTMAGRAYQTLQHQTHTEDSATCVWIPMVNGAQRLGVLGVRVVSEPDDALLAALGRLATAAAGLIVAKEPYGDTIIRLRRRDHLGLASELHYSILPPLSYASAVVTVSAALEPCYEVAGDAIDYSVDAGRTQVAVFDGMGHGLLSAQCAVFTVAAYRSARRSGLDLLGVMESVDQALISGLGGEVFTTCVMADLDTESGLLHWANAGHPNPLLLRDGRVVKVLETEPRPPLGLGDLLPGLGLGVGREQLEPGDIVLAYTDGVVEARSPDGEFFGVDRLADLVRTQLAGGLSAPETMRRVVRELLAHHGGQLTDDATLLMLEWRRPANT
ncbi:MAG TPA: PP2C family protein-serine/threonine phosphatase [Mycobacteriales bacterium]|nr:PP2C family protein-serine/threonine phosphatase [Mycobacteriales bacterium]